MWSKAAEVLWRTRAKYRRRQKERHEITGKRAHHWQDIHLKKGEKKAAEMNQKQIEHERKAIRKWDVLTNQALDLRHHGILTAVK